MAAKKLSKQTLAAFSQLEDHQTRIITDDPLDQFRVPPQFLP